MSLNSFTQLSDEGTLTPNVEAARINEVVANRRLLDGKWREIGVGNLNLPDAQGRDLEVPGVKPNWFKRASSFFPEFMLSDYPVVTVEGNTGMTEWLEEFARAMWAEMFHSLSDRLAYGGAALMAHPDDPFDTPQTHPTCLLYTSPSPRDS